MSEKARALGISDTDLRKALLLARDFRILAINMGLDPRATRIAILYLEKCDRHFMTKKLQPQVARALEEIAEQFFQKIKEREGDI